MWDEKAEILSSRYPKEIRFLSERDPFRFLISVILSAQTTDKAVNAVAQVLFACYPDALSLASADALAVEEIIHPLGFYHTKARNIIAAANKIEEMGSIPETIDELVQIPGVGRKTASCYCGDILHKSAIIVDTHFARVSRRLGYTSSKDPLLIEKDIAAGFDPAVWYRLSMVLNYHGRVCCYAKKPDCMHCPVVTFCKSDDKFIHI